MASLTVRRARAGDEETLLQLNACVQDLHVAERPDFFRVTDREAALEAYRAGIEELSPRIWIAELDGKAVGYTVAQLRERSGNPFCRPQRSCEIDQIAVEPQARRRGVARALIERAVEDVHAIGIDDIELTVWAFNEDAQRAFAKLGFRPKTIRMELRDQAESHARARE